MKFKQGEKVRFLNDIGGGVINSIDHNGIIYVQTDDGFEIPVQSKELIHAVGFTESVNKATVAKPEKEKPAKVQHSQPKPAASLPRNVSADIPVNLILGFIPESNGPVFNSTIGCYLINDSGYNAFYMLGTWERGGFYYLSSGQVEADTKNFVKSFDQTTLSKISGIHVQVVLLSEGRYSRKPPVDQIVDIGLVNFSKESFYRENAYFEEKAVVFNIAGVSESTGEPDIVEVPEAALAQKTVSSNTTTSKPHKKEDTLEVDLHMTESEMQHSMISQSGILTLQMTRFHAALDEAVSKKLRRLVIIHGVGQGTLKMQIRKELQEKYPQYLFQDASFREYGFGATMVHLVADKKQ